VNWGNVWERRLYRWVGLDGFLERLIASEKREVRKKRQRRLFADGEFLKGEFLSPFSEESAGSGM